MSRDDPNAFYAGGLAVETYDLFVEANPLFAHDREIYVDTAREAGGAALELGCGSGRVLEALAEAGLSAVGLDLSPAMLAAAERRLARFGAAAPRLVCAGMDDFDLGARFGSVLITCRAFHHVIEPERQRATLAAARRHLAPGGLLVLDLFDPLLAYAADPEPPLPAPREAADAAGRRFRRTVVERKNDPDRQLVSERLRVEALDPDGRTLRAEETSWALRWLMRQEAAYLLELCGFSAVACYSDFQRAPAAYGREQLWVARAV